MMVCSRGESPTHRMTQMKLFNAIATAAVIGTFFTAANPVQAREDGWRDTTCSYWMAGKYLGKGQCQVQWSDSKVQTINSLVGEYNPSPRTIRPYVGGWVPGRDPECLKLPSTNYAICDGSV